MSVSVVIPCFRCSETIARAVDSVAAQTVSVHELILVDDGSDDGTPAALADMASRSTVPVSVLTLDANRGPAAARNAGWDAATGDHVAFLDADDWWLPGKLEHQMGWMERHGEVVICGTDRSICSPRANQPAGATQAVFVKRFSVLARNPFSTPTVVVVRGLALRFPATLRCAEDYHLWRTAVLSGCRVARLDMALTVLGKAAFGAGGISADMDAMQRGERESLEMLRKEGLIRSWEYVASRCLSELKYARRLLSPGLVRSGVSHSGRPERSTPPDARGK